MIYAVLTTAGIGASEIILGLVSIISGLLVWIVTRQIGAIDGLKEKVSKLETWKATERAKEEEREKSNSNSIGKLVEELAETIEKLEKERRD